MSGLYITSPTKQYSTSSHFWPNWFHLLKIRPIIFNLNSNQTSQAEPIWTFEFQWTPIKFKFKFFQIEFEPQFVNLELVLLDSWQYQPASCLIELSDLELAQFNWQSYLICCPVLILNLSLNVGFRISEKIKMSWLCISVLLKWVV